jgi:L,D-transpeptidase catalytic domain
MPHQTSDYNGFLNIDSQLAAIIRSTLPKKRLNLLCILTPDVIVPVDDRLKELAMRRSSVIATIAFAVAVAANDAEAKLDLYVDKSAQQISIIQNGSLLYVWPVSTGRDRFSTPSGVYTPERLERSWFSKAYYNAPMPHAIFFHNGYAIHGSYDIARLGGPASHGCIRLHPQDAALLFAMVEREGPGNTAIMIGGDRPANPLPPPRYRDFDDPMRLSYLRDGGIARGVYPPGPTMQPYYNVDRYFDGPGRRRGTDGPLPIRGAYPSNRSPAPRLDADAPVEPTLGRRGSNRPAMTARSNSKCPTCSPNRVSDEPANHHASPSEAATPPPAPQQAALPSPASPSPEQQQPSSGYKVLPKSYWAGASWRWRLKREQEITGVPSPTPNSP